MKVIDIINKLDKSDQNKAWVDIEEIARQLNVDIGYKEQKRLNKIK